MQILEARSQQEHQVEAGAATSASDGVNNDLIGRADLLTHIGESERLQIVIKKKLLRGLVNGLDQREPLPWIAVQEVAIGIG